MRKPEEYIKQTVGDVGEGDVEYLADLLKGYTREVLKDYEAWKAHSTPELVERYINEKNL